MESRIRIGLIVPSSDATYEPDFMMVAPPRVTFHSHRVWLPEEDIGQRQMDIMNSEVKDAIRYLATAKVDAIACGGTTSSFYKGPGWDTELLRLIEEASGVPAVVTTRSVVDALRFLGIRKMSIATPYPEWNNRKLLEYMEASGFEIANLEADPWAWEDPDRMINDRDPESILEFASGAFDPSADGLFCSCTAWRSLEIVEELERRTGKPVVTSNQANIWAIFSKLDITDPIPGFGSLLRSFSKLPS